MTEIKPIARRGDAQEKAYEVLKEMIIVQELRPNELVSEKKLADQTGFGRASIRIALQNLKNDGLVEIYAQRGCRISEIDVVVQMKVLEVRAELERLMAVHAAHNITDEVAAKLKGSMRLLAEAAHKGDARQFMDNLRDVHELMAAASDNEILSRSVNQIQGLSRRFWYAYHARYADMSLAADLHAARVDAICRHDAPAAAKASDDLVGYLASFTESVVSRRTQD
jgi:DNA-binding GntR family transcriptional regulator